MSTHKSTADKVKWLRANPKLWEGVNWHNLPYPQYKAMRSHLVERMKYAGLYSFSTNACDVNVLRLIELALAGGA